MPRTPLPRPPASKATDMAAAGLRQRCEQLLRGVDVPDPFNVDVLLARLAVRRQRPVRLLPLLPGLRDDPSGMWVPLPQEDVLFAEGSVSDWYRDHVVLHEVGHMLWEHAGTVRDVTRWLGQYGVEPQPQARVQLRCSVTETEHEQEAEMVALLIESRITRRVRSAGVSTAPNEVAAVLDRLASALGSTGTAGRGAGNGRVGGDARAGLTRD